MADTWTDDRLDAALFGLAGELDVPAPEDLAPSAPPRRVRRWPRVAAVLVAAAAVLAVVVVAVPPARDTVARWFGLRVEQDGAATADGSFADDVAVSDVDAALAAAGLDVDTLTAAGLGRPDAAGTPPEGGVLLAWRDGATTLWVRPGDDDVVVVKRVGPDAADAFVDGVGDYAVLFDGTHVLDTPARRVAAGRVLWWLDDGRQWRLESDRSVAAMTTAARVIADGP